MARSTSSSVAAPDAPVSGVSGGPVALNLLIALRPEQWTKNLLVFAAPLFGMQLFALTGVLRALAAFVIFCALSGVVYLINDIADRESDRRHPLKARRPIASGALSVSAGLTAAVIIGAVALAASFALGWRFASAAAAYVALQTLYSAWLKHMVIVDALTLAGGFVLRAIAGAFAVNVAFSHWLVVCTTLGALFLGLNKRRHEMTLLGVDAASHRPILGEYSPYLLDQMIAVVTASTLISYILYTISPETQQKFGTQWLELTIPFPLYGIFRYLYLVHRREGGGSPSDLLLSDRPLLICGALWVLAVAVIIYRPV